MTGPKPATRPADPSGVAFGALLAVLAAYQQFKLPPVLPLLTSQYGHDPRVAGGFMSVYALAGLALSPVLGRLIERHGLAAYLQSAFALFATGGAIALAWPDSGVLMLFSRSLEGPDSPFSRSSDGTGDRQCRHPISAAGHRSRGDLDPDRPVDRKYRRAPDPGGRRLEAAVVGRAGRNPRDGGLDHAAEPAQRQPQRQLVAARRGPRHRPRQAFQTPAAVGLGGTVLPVVDAVHRLYDVASQLPVSVHGLDPSTAVLGYAVPIVTLLVFNLLTGWAMTRVPGSGRC